MIYRLRLILLVAFGLIACKENNDARIDYRLNGAWEFVLEEQDNQVIIFNHKGPVSYYYFSDSLLHFFSRFYEEETLEYEAFNCWTEDDKIYTTFDDTIKSSIYYELQSHDTLLLSKSIDFNSKMLLVRKEHDLNQLEELINKTFNRTQN